MALKDGLALIGVSIGTVAIQLWIGPPQTNKIVFSAGGIGILLGVGLIVFDGELPRL